MPSTRADTCGLILAGGLGRRMGGIDKGLMTLDGKTPLVERVAQSLQNQVGELIISANRNLEIYQRIARTLSDSLDDFQGPLAGILTAMQYTRAKWLVTVPCDAPRLSPDYVERLYHLTTEANALIGVAHDGKRLQPVHALLNTSLHQALSEYLLQGGRKIDTWYAQHAMVQIDFSDSAYIFENINRPQDQQKFIQSET